MTARSHYLSVLAPEGQEWSCRPPFQTFEIYALLTVRANAHFALNGVRVMVKTHLWRQGAADADSRAILALRAINP